MAEMRLSALAEAVGGEVAAGADGETVVTGITTVEAATESDVTFVTRPKFAAEATASRAAAVLAPADLEVEGKARIICPDIHRAILQAIAIFHPPRVFEPGAHAQAAVDPSARLGEGVHIGAHAVVEADAQIGARSVIEAGAHVGLGAVVGEDCHLQPRSVIMPRCSLGDRVILQPGAVIGSDGFRYEKMEGRMVKIPQVGTVVIEDDVEIGANSAIDRASFTATRIGAGTKIDNLVQIAHNDEIGKDCVIVAQVGLSGSVKVGDRTMLLGQAGVADNLEIGADSIIGAKAGVHNTVAPKSVLLGYPAVPLREARRIWAAWNRLPALLVEVRELRANVRALQGEEEED